MFNAVVLILSSQRAEYLKEPCESVTCLCSGFFSLVPPRLTIVLQLQQPEPLSPGGPASASRIFPPERLDPRSGPSGQRAGTTQGTAFVQPGLPPTQNHGGHRGFRSGLSISQGLADMPWLHGFESQKHLMVTYCVQNHHQQQQQQKLPFIGNFLFSVSVN